MKEICAAPNNATFVGREKQWRPGAVYNKDEQTCDLQYCSYIVESFYKEPKPMKKGKLWPFGPFLWFGTKRDDATIYGTYCFEFHYKKVLTKYAECRGNQSSICYRVGGTLLYADEITHVVIICLEDDKECESYPVIEATTTKYFTPPVVKLQCTDSPCKRRKVEKQFFSHADGNRSKCFLPATFSRNTKLHGKRHEHIALAFYLPHDVVLQLNNQDGKLHNIREDHVKYCVKGSGKRKPCKLGKIDISYFSDFNDPFDYNDFFEHKDGDYPK